MAGGSGDVNLLCMQDYVVPLQMGAVSVDMKLYLQGYVGVPLQRRAGLMLVEAVGGRPVSAKAGGRGAVGAERCWVGG